MTFPLFGAPIVDIDAESAGVSAPTVAGWEIVQDITVSADAQQVDITGLDGDVDEQYMIVCSIINPDAVLDASFTMRINADSGANYDTQQAEWDAAAATAARTGGATAIDLEWDIAALEAGLLIGWLTILTGEWRTIITQAIQAAANIFGSMTFSDWRNTADNITQISLISTNPGTIGVGSRIWLFKPSA